ncbi:MAG: DUF1844 domain-containing protein [Bdellovibrionota bacterium]
MTDQQKIEANISTLALSLGSSAAMAMGLAPNPMNGKIEKNIEVAKFNIDMLMVLKDKTKANLTKEEENLLHRMIVDLQTKFVQVK